MLLGKPIVFQCPGCGCKHMRMNLISGNTFGGIFWSDGFSLTPMLPDIPRFTRCSSCNHLFNLQTCVQYESEGDDAYNLPEVIHPDRKDLEKAIHDQLFTNDEEEIHLRIRLWWTMNDHPVKSGETGTPGEGLPYTENAHRLLHLLKKNKREENALLIAELFRNLGEFDTCKQVLAEISSERIQRRANQIAKACLAGVRGVFRLD